MIKKYFDGLKFGMLLQLAVGPMCLMVFNTAKNVSFLVALSLVLAIALVDAFYILLAGLGVSKLIEKKNVKAIFKIVGSLVLVIFGLNIILNVFNINLIPGLNLKPNTANISIQGLILTLSNPITIVDKDVFDKVQEMLKVQRRSTNKNDLLSGYLFCEDCGAPMILIKGKNNAYYYCRSNRSKGICTKHTIRQTILYNNVIDLLNKKK